MLNFAKEKQWHPNLQCELVVEKCQTERKQKESIENLSQLCQLVLVQAASTSTVCAHPIQELVKATRAKARCTPRQQRQS